MTPYLISFPLDFLKFKFSALLLIIISAFCAYSLFDYFVIVLLVKQLKIYCEGNC